jgi:antitoxin CptB
MEPQLRWRCRRGIKEMDLLLEKFLDDVYPQLKPEEKKDFELFLNEADLDIYAWITGKSRPENPLYRKFITHLQQIKPRVHE